VATNKDFIVKNGLSVGEDISVSGSVTSNLQFDDSIQLKLGTDGDLLLYHTGGTSYIDSQTISLVVESPLTTDGAGNEKLLAVMQAMLDQQTKGTRLQGEQLQAARNN